MAVIKMSPSLECVVRPSLSLDFLYIILKIQLLFVCLCLFLLSLGTSLDVEKIEVSIYIFFFSYSIAGMACCHLKLSMSALFLPSWSVTPRLRSSNSSQPGSLCSGDHNRSQF